MERIDREKQREFREYLKEASATMVDRVTESPYHVVQKPDCLYVDGPGVAVCAEPHNADAIAKALNIAYQRVTESRDAELVRLRAERDRLREALRDLLDRVDRNGGIGPYIGGAPFAVRNARAALKGASDAD